MASEHETIFTMEATPVKFGRGASAEAGWELGRLGVRRVMLVTDPGVAALGHPERIKGLIEAEGIEVVLYDRARVEPTIESLQDAVEFALEHEVDGFVSVGGGSSIDTAKVANLVVHPPGARDGLRESAVRGGEEAAVAAEAPPRDPDDLRDRLGGDHGRGARHPGPEGQDRDLAPLPKRPTQAIVDPDLSRSLPPEVTSSTGLDVVCHAAESFLSKPFETRARPDSPDDRPPYQGSNPVADVWSAKALEFGGLYLRRAVADSDDVEARGFMMLAATMAGVGLRLRRRAHSARMRVSDRLGQARIPARRLPGRPPVRAPRPFGDRHRAGRVPVHLRRDARAPRSRRRAARRRSDRRSRPGHAPGRPASTNARHPGPPRRRRVRLHRGRHPRRSSTVRSSSSGCSRWRPRTVAEDDLAAHHHRIDEQLVGGR